VHFFAIYSGINIRSGKAKEYQNTCFFFKVWQVILDCSMGIHSGKVRGVKVEPLAVSTLEKSKKYIPTSCLGCDIMGDKGEIVNKA